MELYSEVKNAFQRKSLAKAIIGIVAATKVAPHYAEIKKELADKLVAAEPTFLLLDMNSVTGEGDKATIRVQASAAGIAAVEASPALTPTPRAVVDSASIEIESGIPVPEIKRGGERTSAYPFHKLEIGQSFFIPNTEQMPDAAKAMATVVSSATRRFKTENPPRVFTIRGKEKGKDGVTLGARIWRIAPQEATAAQASGADPTASATTV